MYLPFIVLSALVASFACLVFLARRNRHVPGYGAAAMAVLLAILLAVAVLLCNTANVDLKEL
jgi:hypothetical protein